MDIYDFSKMLLPMVWFAQRNLGGQVVRHQGGGGNSAEKDKKKSMALL
jgi:hypothetical protein